MKWLLAVMLAAASVETPGIATDARHARHRESIEQLAQLNEEVAQEGRLVSPEVDAALLAAVQHHESRMRTYVGDGDCRPVLDPRGEGWLRECRAVGPMQLAKGVGQWLPRMWPGRWQPLTVEQLRIAPANVRAGYDVLVHWKRECGGAPGVWLQAYRMGRCPRRVGTLAVSRCALAWAMVSRSGATAPACGHEGRPLSRRDGVLVRRVSSVALSPP